MELKKTDLLFLALALVLLAPQNSHAIALSKDSAATPSAEAAAETPPSEGPACNLEATVRSIQQNAEKPEYYDVSVEINGINATEPDTVSVCSQNYANQIEKTGQILKASLYQEKAIREGDGIKAQVQFEGDGTMSGYFLKDIQIIRQSDIQVPNQTETEDYTADDGVLIKENDSTKMLFASLTILTLFALSAMIYSTREKK